MRRRGAAGSRDLMGPVGWIFADVLLALTVVFLATQTGGAVKKEPSRSTTTEPTEKPSTTTTAEDNPPGVDSRFICFRVTANPTLLTGPRSPERDAHLADLEQQVAARLAEPDLDGRRAGIVLSFGVAEEPSAGKARAQAFNDEVLPGFPDVFQRPDGGSVAKRAFWDGQVTADRPAGSIAVNIYPIIGNKHGPLDEEYEKAC